MRPRTCGWHVSTSPPSRAPIVLRGSPQQAHRDPCGHYHDGVFRVWHSSIRGAADSSWSAATAVTESRDLITWSEPRDVTPRDPGRSTTPAPGT